MTCYLRSGKKTPSKALQKVGCIQNVFFGKLHSCIPPK